jgi:hypothetical protein
MNTEPDYDLTPDQWETLKALRAPRQAGRPLNRLTLERLVALDLVSLTGATPAMTALGRRVLIRGGSSRLLDVAA